MATQGIKVHEGNALNKDFIRMTIPLFMMAFFFYGPRVLLLALLGVLTARLTDRLASLLRARRYDRTENSSVTMALIIVLMTPVTVEWHVVVAAVLVAVLVAKEAFGGYMSYPFNPAAVGVCVAVVSWPEQMLRYPAPTGWLLQKGLTFQQMWALWFFKDAPLVEGPSTTLRAGALPKIEFWNLLLGNYAAPLGVACTVVIAACAVYLVIKKRIPVLAPLCFLAMVAAIAFVFPRYTEISFQTWPQDIMQRLQVVKFEGLSGSIVFSAVFMVGEPGTLPKNRVSQVIYGTLLGVACMMFRYFGTYELSVCFAFLLVNAVSGYFDRAIAGAGAKRAKRREAARS